MCVCVFATVCANPVSVSTNLSLLPVWSPTPPSHLISPSFCRPNTLPRTVHVCVCVSVCGLMLQNIVQSNRFQNTQCVHFSHSRWITVNLPTPTPPSAMKGLNWDPFKAQINATDESLGTFYRYCKLTITSDLSLSLAGKLLSTIFYVTVKDARLEIDESALPRPRGIPRIIRQRLMLRLNANDD